MSSLACLVQMAAVLPSCAWHVIPYKLLLFQEQDSALIRCAAIA
jgi:hypothetical protein